MKYLFLICKLFGILTFAIAQPDPEITVPEKIKPFVTKGYEALDIMDKDLNGDGFKDYLLVLNIAGEDTITFDNPQWDIARSVLLITGQPGNKYKLSATNNKLVYCRNCGGSMGDPYEGITTLPGEFIISHYGGSSWRWTDAVSFRYDKAKKNWYLQTHSISSFQAGDPEATTTETVINRSEIGDITFANYTPAYNTDTSSWKVVAAKTYFYNSPDIKSKPRKGYLVKNNIVKSLKGFRNFVECSYENDKGNITNGFLLKKDLLLMNIPKK
jgi:hypothetical protein